MKYIVHLGCALLLALSLGAFAGAPQPQSATPSLAVDAAVYTAKVLWVSDGDSVTVQDAYGRKRKLRLAYIDAPELNQAEGQASKRHLAALIDRQTVTVHTFTRDRYGREIAQITYNDTDANLRQIADGMAWHYRSIARREQSQADFGRYAAAQAQAEQARIGLWAGKAPLAPWDWRRVHKPQKGLAQ